MRLKVSICIAVYNEEKNVRALLHAILNQTRKPDELVIVDDGSSDQTFSILMEFEEKFRGQLAIQVLRQKNSGPAVARNLAWRTAASDVCVFTDGDCLPAPDWLERLVRPLENSDQILAVGGMYSAPKVKELLPRFIGYEILWRYKDTGKYVNCHGSYNLAIRKEVLKALQGFNESYPKPSGEDFDLTYRISQMGSIYLAREATVDHEHPDHFWSYLKNQARRGYDRLKLYLDHPNRMKGDSYTDSWVKYEVLAVGFLFCALPLSLFSEVNRMIAGALLLFLFLASSRPAIYLWKNAGLSTAIYGMAVRFLRVFAWTLGMILGAVSLVLQRQSKGRAGNVI